MTSSVFTQVYAEDWGMFLLSYGQAICFWALGTMALALIVKTVRHKYTLSASSGIYLMLTVGTVISFMDNGIKTDKWKLCKSLLDSE
ncbi:MAG: hypothetical protein JWQ71_1064 [Pedosphaera sp.]|nr:hypothetical protein [Pedosphaera sp.]